VGVRQQAVVGRCADEGVATCKVPACGLCCAVVACRATSFARSNQAQVKKLRNIVQLEVGSGAA
jgi:hypothetical protein